MKIIIIGVTGMLGYSLFKNMTDFSHLDVYGTVRSLKGKEKFFVGIENKLIKGVDATEISTIEKAIRKVKPDVVINCIGLIKQHSISKQHIDSITINGLLPHQLANLCNKYSCKLIHFSTDCVFDGSKGMYTEEDLADASDLYGKSKSIGEVDYAPHLTIRTSIIGHELSTNVSLVDWFLSQDSTVLGFSGAIFSGLPTCVISQLLVSKILPDKNITGLYHLSAEPINKMNLLTIIARIYENGIKVIESAELKIDRSLNSVKLRNLLDLEIPSWDKLILDMHEDFVKRYDQFR